MPESQNIEYKAKWKDEYLKWICGFANANGGTIFIGKDDKGTVVGLENANKLMEDIPNKTRSILGVVVDVNLHHTDKGEYIEIKIDDYPNPVNYKGQYHYRSGSTKQELKGTALDKFMLRKKGKKWDGVPIPNVSINDLDKDTFDFFRKQAKKSKRIDEKVLSDSNELLLENLHLKENEYIKRAGVLLFHPKPEKYVTGAYIKIGFFKTDADLMYQDEIHGNLFNQVEKTIDLLFTKYIKALISYEGIHRIETYEYPKEAIREALLNAISHKDYSSGYPIQISVYKDKIMIWNSGELPENWTVKDLTEKHSSKPYNPDIANTFFRSGYVESWGRGIDNLINQCVEHGLPEPTFKYKTSDFWIIFKKDIFNKEYLDKLGLKERQVTALLYWKEKGEIINKDYSEKFDITSRTALRDITELVDKELLIKIGEKKKAKYIYKDSFVG